MMHRLASSCRRWLRMLLLVFVFVAVVPPVLVAAYFKWGNVTDFEPALTQASARSEQTLVWAVRIGSQSVERNSIGWSTNSIGINADGTEAQRHRLQVTDVGTLQATYQATYLARFHGTWFPVVATVFRDVTPEGKVSNSVELNGLSPLKSYSIFILTSSVFLFAFFELIHLFENRKRTPRI